MSGQPVGQIFAEIGIDYSPATKAQQQLLKDATSTSTNIEQNFKNLGVTSSATFDLMRQKITNSFDMIAASGKASSADIIRAEEAKNAKIQSLNEQQFGKQTSMIDGLKANWIAASVAVVGAWALVNKAVDLMEVGAKSQQAEESFRLMASASNESAEGILAAMKRASAGTIDDSDLMLKASKAMALGMKGADLPGILEAARVAARFTGQDVSQAYEAITDAIATGMPRALKQYGLITKEEMAVVDGAIKAGVENVDLYKIAMLNATIQGEKFGAMHDTNSEKIQRFKAEIHDLTETISIGFINAWNVMTGSAESRAAAAVELVQGSLGIAKVANDRAAIDAKDQRDISIAGAEAVKKAVIDNIKQQTEAAKNGAKDELDLLKLKQDAEDQYNRNIAQATAEQIKRDMDFQKVGEEIVQKAAEQKAKWNAAVYQEEMKQFQDLMEEDQKWRDQQAKNGAKAAEDQAKALLKDLDYYSKFTVDVEKMLDDQDKKEADLIEKRGEAYRQIYKDMKGYEGDYYEASITVLDAQAKKYRILGVDQKVVDGWRREEGTRAWITYAKSSDSFFTGVRAGFKALELSQMHWGEAGIELVKTFATSGQSALSSLFFDAIKGQTKSFGDYFDSFLDSMLKKLTDIAAQMAIQWLLFGNTSGSGNGVVGAVAGASGGSGSGSGGIIGGIKDIYSLGKNAYDLYTGASSLYTAAELSSATAAANAGTATAGQLAIIADAADMSAGAGMTAAGAATVGEGTAAGTGAAVGAGEGAAGVGAGVGGAITGAGYAAIIYSAYNVLFSPGGFLGPASESNYQSPQFYAYHDAYDAAARAAGVDPNQANPGWWESHYDTMDPRQIQIAVEAVKQAYANPAFDAAGKHAVNQGWPDTFPGYERGIDYVPRTGLAVLHEGEGVTPKEKNIAGRSIVLDISIPVVIDGREIDRITAKRVISGGDLTTAIDRRIKVMVN
jgi:hypothetical protein